MRPMRPPRPTLLAPRPPWGREGCVTPAARPRLFQVLAEEFEDIAPKLVGRPFAITRAVIGQEGMAGILIHLGRDILSRRLRALLQLGFESDRRVLVLDAEHAEQRAVQLADHVERRLRPGRIALLVGVGAVDKAAPAI